MTLPSSGDRLCNGLILAKYQKHARQFVHTDVPLISHGKSMDPEPYDTLDTWSGMSDLTNFRGYKMFRFDLTPSIISE
jgi:hypothetical protein